VKKMLAGLLSGLGKIWLEKTVSKQIRINLLLISLQVVLIVAFFFRLPPQIPLFFSQPWGELQLSQPFFLVVLPLLSFTLLITNTLLATVFLDKEAFLSQVLVVGSTFVSLFNLIAIIKILTLSL